ncbi:hypothetical protein GSN00_03745 [Cylindrospermopsis raciborskii CHAB3438]|uniref:hypothetical protein n=1 Tax=Cylindrospermopsis raciborskii TaxID=77022 RepID=UPI001F0E14B4|nr:hypothetical protein [Cylindrospermopsis raciborskii]MCH4903512.1 hypothetical protein [Cylindrospermopsis raciborskii CHAB3438]
MNINCDQFSWFDASAEVKELLVLATKTWENPEESLKYMEQALAETKENNHMDVLVAAYRYFYYQNNYALAEKTANTIIARIRKTHQLPDNWEELRSVLLARKDESQIRIFLNAYTALGMISAKLGKLDQAKAIIKEIQKINDKEDFGANILWQILNPSLEEDG